MADNITPLDLADAQLIGFATAKRNPDSIIELVESMGLTKQEWIEWKANYTQYLSESDIDAVDRHFGIRLK